MGKYALSICTDKDTNAETAIDHLTWSFPGAQAGAPRAVLSLASAGDMKFRYGEPNPNRDRFFASLGSSPDRTCGIELHHTRRVVHISNRADYVRAIEETESSGGVDGILCGDSNLAVSVTVADCMPIWLYDEHSGSFGVLHSGWKGTGILGEAVSLLESRFDTRPEDISVILGPAIGACCYRVPPERAHAFALEFGEDCVVRSDGSDGTESFSLDLRRANLKLAARIGLRRVKDVTICTRCDVRLGSYRRQGAANFTRMAAACGAFRI